MVRRPKGWDWRAVAFVFLLGVASSYAAQYLFQQRQQQAQMTRASGVIVRAYDDRRRSD